jgi:hypothetical protein
MGGDGREVLKFAVAALELAGVGLELLVGALHFLHEDADLVDGGVDDEETFEDEDDDDEAKDFELELLEVGATGDRSGLGVSNSGGDGGGGGGFVIDERADEVGCRGGIGDCRGLLLKPCEQGVGRLDGQGSIRIGLGDRRVRSSVWPVFDLGVTGEVRCDLAVVDA